MPGVAKREQDWQAEDDARTLMEAETIRNDAKRLKRARGKLDQQRKRAEEAANRNKLEAKVAKKLKEAS